MLAQRKKQRQEGKEEQEQEQEQKQKQEKEKEKEKAALGVTIMVMMPCHRAVLSVPVFEPGEKIRKGKAPPCEDSDKIERRWKKKRRKSG